MIDKLNEILKGIDKDQCESDDGWWETSSGAGFGSEKLKEVQDLVKNLSGVVNCVYVVTERDNYGEQLFRQVFAKKEQAVEYLSKQGLKAGNIDEINEVELD